MVNLHIDGTTPEVLLRVDDLYKNFYTRSHGKKITTYALRGVTFSLHKGEAVAIVGESGCGKTTLARIIAGLDEPTRGALTYESKKLTYDTNLRKKISMVFQDPYASLNPRMTIKAIIKEPMHLLKSGLKNDEGDKAYTRNMFKKKKNDLCNELMDSVKLRREWLDRYPFEFSGGQRQRIGVARALATDPDLLILDEPVSALDVSVQAGIINLLKQLRKDRTLSMLFISHDLRVVRHLCDRVVVMYLGQIMEEATTKQLFSHPRHPYTRALIGAIPTNNFDLVDSVMSKDEMTSDLPKMHLIEGELPSPTNPPEGCPFKTRCDKATDKCNVKPPLAKMNDGRLISCHFPE